MTCANYKSTYVYMMLDKKPGTYRVDYSGVRA